MKEKENKEIKELKAKIAELSAGWQRTQADFINYKKQAAEEKGRIIRLANADLVYDLLSVLDHFQLAASHMPKELENNNWATGIKQIERQLETMLLSSGLEKIDALGKEFDPNFHEAIEEVESNEKEGTVVEEILPGYTFQGELLRPTRVKVAERAQK